MDLLKQINFLIIFNNFMRCTCRWSLYKMNKNIVLTQNTEMKRMVFLDLKNLQGDQLRTQSYFKPTDRNYPQDSFHHRTWLCNIQRGQFVSLRRNCSWKTDYFRTSMNIDWWCIIAYSTRNLKGSSKNIGNFCCWSRDWTFYSDLPLL